MTRVGVIGAGSWGTAIANLMAGKGFTVDLWVREASVYREIRDNRKNTIFLPDVSLAGGIRPVSAFEAAVGAKELVVMAIPSHVFREVLGSVSRHLGPQTDVLILTKGIENDSLMLMSQVADSLLGEDRMARFACLTGPSFAREVACCQPTAVTIACRDSGHARRLQRLFATDFFRVYVTKDLMGAQVGGALKNVIAIASGASDGLEFGHNARAALITRGLAEITRLGVRMGAKPETFAGLAGLGDLVLTCTGALSRNRTVGLKVGRGMRVDEITRDMNMVAEGIKNTSAAYALSLKEKVDMPITRAVYEILYEGKSPESTVRELMGRDLKTEITPA
ncbi:MAG: NAD(P)H-dependent glycerol-3-phosphate dehydrogenase [Deltaproteobacteria bacterium]|nr:NAD(P)H-dependent glycerol-3-phosphate dehydrogenase [Deltaproteobacteria bacterium]